MSFVAKFLKYHGGKGFPHDVNNAINQVAAQYAYAQSLAEQIQRIDREYYDQDIEKAFYILRWLGRGERKADRFEKQVIEDLKEIGDHFSLQIQAHAKTLAGQLLIAERRIINATSLHTGTLRQEFQRIETYEQLLSKSLDNKVLRAQCKEFIDQTRSDIEDILRWLAAVEELLRDAKNLSQTIVKDSLLVSAGISRVPSLDELYKAYKYSPPPEEKANTLNIDLPSTAVDSLVKEAQTLLCLSDASIKSNKQNVRIPLSTAVVELDIYGGFEDNNIIFKITLITSKIVADFRCERRTPVWTLTHRWVDPKHQGQKLGSIMLSLMEQCLAKFAAENGNTQNMIIEARQISVVLFALKNNYLPLGLVDRRRLQQLFSISNELMLTTGVAYREDGGNLPGFIFQKDIVLRVATEYHNRNVSEDEIPQLNIPQIFYREPAAFINSGYTIKFIKPLG